MKESYYEQYLRSYSYAELSKKYSMDEPGLWNIYGEDANCDFGGPHHTPFLEQVEGKLGDVIFYAVELTGFWQWGSGGRIEKAVKNKVTKVGPRSEQIAKQKKIAALKAEIKKLEESHGEEIKKLEAEIEKL